jgi:hypothetical protein
MLRSVNNWKPTRPSQPLSCTFHSSPTVSIPSASQSSSALESFLPGRGGRRCHSAPPFLICYQPYEIRGTEQSSRLGSWRPERCNTETHMMALSPGLLQPPRPATKVIGEGGSQAAWWLYGGAKGEQPRSYRSGPRSPPATLRAAWACRGDASRSAREGPTVGDSHAIPCRFNGRWVGTLWNRRAKDKGAGRPPYLAPWVSISQARTLPPAFGAAPPARANTSPARS